mmetsp:Transcript_34617/g.63271  ORF Transcript_34617/g.63271 Transcript_34617/m.63271 type:complete len:614 (-) Transcript_34617:35-1876(-)
MQDPPQQRHAGEAAAASSAQVAQERSNDHSGQGWAAVELLAGQSNPQASSSSSKRMLPVWLQAERVSQFVESTGFTSTTLVVICINAMWIGIDTEWNNTTLKEADGSLPLEPYSELVENLFCVYFTVEVFLRFIAFKDKSRIYRDLWFVFDTTLVLLMILETWVFRIIEAFGGDQGGADLSNFSTLRILRLTRMVRMARSIGELRTLVRGMISAIRAVVSLLVFLVGLTYVFAIFFTTILACPPGDTTERCDDGWELFPGEDPVARYLFGSIGSSMMTLFTNGMLGDNLYWVLDIIKNDSLVMYWLFCIYFLISALTLLNMLIGVLCDTIADTTEKEKQSQKEMNFQECMARCFREIDTDGSGTVTYMEWHEIKQDPTVRERLAADLMVDPDQVDGTMVKMEAVLFADASQQQAGRNGVKHDSHHARKSARHSILDSCEPEEGLTRDDFVKLMVRLSPEKAATPIDVELLRSVMGRFEKLVMRALRAMREQLLRQSSGTAAQRALFNAPPQLSRQLMSTPEAEEGSTLRATAASSRPHTPGDEPPVLHVAPLPSDANPLPAVEEVHTPPAGDLRLISLTSDEHFSTNEWLYNIPTEFLMVALRKRAKKVGIGL